MEDFHYSTDAEWDRAEALEIGAAHPDRAWVCTGRDVWHKNPYYTGPEVPHPEEYDDAEECVGGDHPFDDEIPF